MEHKFTKAKQFFNEIKTTVWLYRNLWKEATTALIRSPRDVDKTAVALSIAADVAASGREVLYVNAEQRVDCHPELAADIDNLYIFTPEHESPDDPADYADLVFEAIDQAVRTTDIRTFVVDSVSRIAALSFGKNASPAYIMKRLVALQVKYKISLLVLADNATKTVNNALTALAASEISENYNQSETSDHPATASPLPLQAPDRASCIVHRASPQLTRRERRALQRRTSPRPDRFAGPHFKLPQKII